LLQIVKWSGSENLARNRQKLIFNKFLDFKPTEQLTFEHRNVRELGGVNNSTSKKGSGDWIC